MLSAPHLQIPLPPFWPEAAKLLEDYKQAARKRNEAGAAVSDLDRRTHMVKQADTEAHAEALRAGKSRPPERLAKHQAEIDAKRAELIPLGMNRDRAADAFLSHIEAHRAEYRAVLIEHLADLGNQSLTLDTVEQIEELLAWQAWIDRFPRKAHTLLPVNLAVGFHGEKLSVKQLLTAISDAVAEATQAEESEREEVSA